MSEHEVAHEVTHQDEMPQKAPANTPVNPAHEDDGFSELRALFPTQYDPDEIALMKKRMLWHPRPTQDKFAFPANLTLCIRLRLHVFCLILEWIMNP